MKPAYKRVKGAKLERKIAKEFRRSGLDKKARRSWQSGATWFWKSDIYTSLNYSIEAKNQEGIKKVWDWWEQAESQRKPYSPPVLMFTSNYRPILATMKLEDWISLVKEKEEYKNLVKELKKYDIRKYKGWDKDAIYADVVGVLKQINKE